MVAAQFAALDLVFRGASAAWGSPVRVVADLVTSTALLLGFAVLATSRVRRAVLAVLAAAVLVLQILVFRYFHTPLDVQVVASALFSKHEVRPVLMRILPAYLSAVALVATVEYGLLAFAHRTLARGAGRSSRGLGVVLAMASLGGVFGAGPRWATPEVRAVHAISAVTDRREAAVASAIAVAPLHAERAELPSILFVLTESVRASDYRPGGDTPTAPETARLTRGRTDLSQLRSVSSYTALSLSAILTGRSQEGAREAILRAPGLFDYARAARDRRGARPEIAYFSAQPSTVFETDEVRAAVDRFATLETIRGRNVEDDPDYGELPLDREIVDLFLKELPSLRSPSVAMLHLIGTHAPYFIDEARAPFKPFGHVVSWSGMPALLNAYRDSIYEQDRTLARAVKGFVDQATSRGLPWLVVFTSDHGEAFGEHGAIHHGQNLLDEQVHVPGWIASGGGALTAAQARALEDHTGRFLTHLDLLPTLLDAMGVWDNFSVAPHRAAMPGRSLLRPYEARAPVPVTNCTPMFPCPTNTWGLLAEDRKLVAHLWDGGWYCMALGSGESVVDHADPACDRLRAASRSTFPLLPNGAPNR
jgi:glucan phosphoethanolaminetransferase (alkaline phosphatase superfamily)